MAATLLGSRGIGAVAQSTPADAAGIQELRIAANAQALRLDPHLTYGLSQVGTFTYFIWAGLTKLDAPLTAVPDIATDWDISDDGKTYTFHLDPDRKFSDGSPITAHDFAWSWTRVLTPETESLDAGTYLRDVVGAVDFWSAATTDPPMGFEALDDYTFRVELIEPRNYFPEVLIHPSTFVVKQSDVEAGSESAPWFTTAQAFSGPYQVESVEMQQSLVLVPNPNYPETQTIQRITYRLVDDPQTQFLLYENDEVDLTPIAVPEADNIKNEDTTYRDQLVEQPLWWEENLYLRNNLAPFDDERVRRAFMLAIDEEALLATVLKGLNPDIDGVLYPGMDAYTADVPQVSFDPEAAQEELAKSSYGRAEELPPIDFWLTDEARTGTEGRLAAALQEMWRQHLGVEVSIRIVPSYGEMLESDVQIVIAGEAPHYPDSSDAISYLRCQAGANIAQFCNEDWEATVDEAARVSDEATSIELYREAELMLLEGAVLYPLYQRVEYFLVKPYVRNLQTSAMYTFPDFEEVYIAEH